MLSQNRALQSLDYFNCLYQQPFSEAFPSTEDLLAEMEE